MSSYTQDPDYSPEASLARSADFWAPQTAALFTPAQRQTIRQAIAENRLNLQYYNANFESDGPTVGCMIGQVYGDWENLPPVLAGALTSPQAVAWEESTLIMLRLLPVLAGALTSEETVAWERSTLDMLDALPGLYADHTTNDLTTRQLSGRIAAAYLDAADALDTDSA